MFANLLFSVVLVCGGVRFFSVSITRTGTLLGLLTSVRTVKSWEMVCVAGDLCFVRSRFSSCATRLVAVVVADIHSSLVHGSWYFGGYGNSRAK